MVKLTAIKSVVNLSHQERGRRGEHGQGLILSFEKSVQNKNFSIFDADKLYIIIFSKFTIFLRRIADRT